MLVYGDHPRTLEPARTLEALRERARSLDAHPAGLARHAALTSLLLDAGALAQGLLDHAFHAEGGQDAPGPEARWVAAWLRALGERVRASWEGEPAQVAVPWEPPAPLPERVEVKTPEGYAFYALYPEAYLEAARALRDGDGPLVVLGLRSIGTSLGAVVAAGARAHALHTVRPTGHPFRRTLALSDALAREVLVPGARYAVVDEGPGLSGSSFGAVGDWLEARGVPRSALQAVPAHAGELGPEASEAHRARWAEVKRHAPDFDALFVASGRLARWAEGVTGPADGALEDVGGGGWRAHVFAREADWPAVHPWQERRKYLLRAGGRRWLLKFTGLGEVGERQHARAEQLARAGWGTPVAALVHGFGVAPWLEGAQPVSRGLTALSREAFVAHVGRYLGWRARTLPAAEDHGARIEALYEMARHNTAEALGEERARALEAFVPRLGAWQRAARPVETDGRLHAWEWLQLPDGRVLKADGVDHCEAHDLVGCQDVLWDVAGAECELGLTLAELGHLCESLAREAGRAPDVDALPFYRVAYRAFQLGHHALAARAMGGAERRRLEQAAARYASALEAVLP